MCIRDRTGRVQLLAVASTYGFFSGLVGSGSVIKAIFFRQLQLGKEAFVGTMAATSMVATIGKIAAYSQTGLLNRTMLPVIIALAAVAMAAALIGKRYLRKIDSRLFNNGVLVMLAVAALGLLL